MTSDETALRAIRRQRLASGRLQPGRVLVADAFAVVYRAGDSALADDTGDCGASAGVGGSGIAVGRNYGIPPFLIGGHSFC